MGVLHQNGGDSNALPATPASTEAFAPLTREQLMRMSGPQRERYELATRSAALTSQDFPVLPTSHTDATPQLPDEPGDNFTPGQRLAIAALVAGETFVAAARAAKVSRRTLFGWRQEPAFQEAVERTSREAMATVVVRVRNMMLRGTRVLSEAITERDRGADHAFKVLNSYRLWAAATEGRDAR